MPLKLLSPSAQATPRLLQGQNVYLRAPKPSDYQEWAQVRAANQEFLKPFEPEWPQDCLSVEFYKRRLKRQAQERREGRGEFFFIFEARDQNLIGGVNLNNIYGGALCHASLGYWIDQNYEGMGLMRDAVSCVIDHAFNTQGLRRINAACLPDNHRSIKLLQRLEFEEEGFAKAYYQINSVWQDHLLFGLCALPRHLE